MDDASPIVSEEPLTPALTSSITAIRVFTTQHQMFIIGEQPNQSYRVMTLDRRARTATATTATATADEHPDNTIQLHCHADKRVYNHHEIETYTAQLETRFPNMKLTGTAHGLLGFVRFTQGYYCHFVTQIGKAPVGAIGGHPVHVVKETKLVSITFRPKMSTVEQRMKTAYEACELGGNDCFFSYTYDLTHTLQQNVKARHRARTVGTTAVTSNDRFIWNAHAMQELIMCVGVPSCWILPLVHGFFEQKHVKTTTGRNLALTLIARRSRYFAGTRYNRRGADVLGNVANEVETEQLLCDIDVGGMSTSLVQVRGSIPLHWCHFNLRSPKPGFKLYKQDEMFVAARRHFQNLEDRYGPGVSSINLIRQHEDVPKELILLEEYGKCIPYLNTQKQQAQKQQEGERKQHQQQHSQPIKYKAYDFNMNAKDPDVDVLKVVTGLMSELSEGMAFFSSHRQRGSSHKWSVVCQTGVVRTNCVDCLDRTNVTQFCLGKLTLPRQLEALGIEVHPSSANELWPHLMQMWARHGNEMGMQYAGSGAMHSLALDVGSGTNGTSGTSGSSGSSGNGRESMEASQRSDLSSSSANRSSNASASLHRATASSFDHRISDVSDVSRRLSSSFATDDLDDNVASNASGNGNGYATESEPQQQQQQQDVQKIVLTKGVKNAMVAVTRYISNNWSDDQRQKNMNQFLGLKGPPTVIKLLEKQGIDSDLLSKETMYRASVSTLPSLLCMQILRKSQHRTFEERYDASDLTSFNEKIAWDKHEHKQETANHSRSSSTHFREHSTNPDVITNGVSSLTVGELLNPIVIQADEISATGLDLGLQQQAQQIQRDQAALSPLTFDGMWRVATNYDELYHRGDVVHELTTKYQRHDQQNKKIYNEYCLENKTKTLLKHFVFDRKMKNIEMYGTNLVASLFHGHSKYQRADQQVDSSSGSSSGSSGGEEEDDEEEESSTVLSPSKLHEQESMYKLHVNLGEKISSPPLLYQDGEFTRLSNRRDSWVVNKKELTPTPKKKKKKKKKKGTLFGRFSRSKNKKESAAK